MTRTLLIFCLVTVLAHAGVTFLRWLLVKLERSSHDVLYLMATVLVTGGLLVLKAPPVKEWLVALIKPVAAELGFAAVVYAIEFVLVTAMLRMLFEQFVLRMTYSKAEWILSCVLVGGWTVLTFLFW